MSSTGPQEPKFEAPIYGSSGPSAPPQPTNPTRNPYTSPPASNDYSRSVSRPPPVETKTNPLAIAAVVSIFLFPIASGIFGLIALNQIKNSGGSQRGEGMAIAGIDVGVLIVIVLLFALLGAGK